MKYEEPKMEIIELDGMSLCTIVSGGEGAGQQKPEGELDII